MTCLVTALLRMRVTVTLTVPVDQPLVQCSLMIMSHHCLLAGPLFQCHPLMQLLGLSALQRLLLQYLLSQHVLQLRRLVNKSPALSLVIM